MPSKLGLPPGVRGNVSGAAKSPLASAIAMMAIWCVRIQELSKHIRLEARQDRLFFTLMHKTVVAIAVAVCAAGQTPESTKTAVMATVHQFVDGFNKGDTKTAAAACADQTSIIDEFPPHEWHGAGACAKWMSDYDANAKKDGITGGMVTLSEPWHV